MAERMPIPDRVCVDPGAYYQSTALTRHLVVKLDGVAQQAAVVEFCISEGWVRRVKVDEKGRAVISGYHEHFDVEVVHGKVEVYWT